MGLSASQTRYLSLTARKSNVEFQGQQINQARTALANQSADLYKQISNLKAPTAPSIYDYIINPTTLPVINWNAEATGTVDEEGKIVPQGLTWPLNSAEQKNFEIYYAANQPSFQSFNIPEYTYYEDENGKQGYCTITYDKDRKPIYGTEFYDTEENIPGTYCVKKQGYDFSHNPITYTSIHVDENEDYTYNKSTGLFDVKDGLTYSDLPLYIQAYNAARGQYNTYSKPQKVAIYNRELTETEQTQIKDTNTENNGDVEGYSSSSSVSYNEAQYQAALVKYNEETEEYERILAEINSKTEEVHEADKKLELELKQLDTEQEAIQTEMEAVQKVINKNIEQTFKTFA